MVGGRRLRAQGHVADLDLLRHRDAGEGAYDSLPASHVLLGEPRLRERRRAVLQRRAVGDHRGLACRELAQVGEQVGSRGHVRRRADGKRERRAVQSLGEHERPQRSAVEALDHVPEVRGHDDDAAVAHDALARQQPDAVDGLPGQSPPLTADPDAYAELVDHQQRRPCVDERREVARAHGCERSAHQGVDP